MTLKGTFSKLLKAYDWLGKQLERFKWGATIVGIVITLSHWQACNDRNASDASWKSILTMKDATIDYYKKGDRTIGEIMGAKVDKKDFEALAKQDKDVQEELAYAQIKAKNAESVIKVLQKASVPATDIKLTPVWNDTSTGFKLKLKDTSKLQALLPPFHFNKDTSLYHIDGTISNQVLHLNNFSMIDTLGLVTGEKRKNIFSRAKFMITINHSNPYVATNKIEDYDVTPHKYFWQTTGFKIGFGVVGGILIAHTLKL